MTRHFQPAWRKDYGVSRKRWRRLSGLEKTKVINNIRDRVRAEILAHNLAAPDPSWMIPIPFSGPFVRDVDTQEFYDSDTTVRGSRSSVAGEEQAYF